MFPIKVLKTESVLKLKNIAKIVQRSISTATMESANWPRVKPEDARSFVIQSLEAVGTKKEHAEIMAELLVVADHRGHYSHGMNRVEVYVDDIQAGITVCDKVPEIMKETVSTAWVDGNNLLGGVVGKFCIDLAIKKAKETGIACVSARNSNHYGIAGWYGLRAAEQGLIGMAFTNSTPWVVPTRSSQRILGTNPIAFVAPALHGDSFALDMATSTVAQGKLEVCRVKNVANPKGWAVDDQGRECTDPHTVLKKGGGLYPLGGNEQTGGYKGYGLGLMVDVLCGMLSGSTYGPNVKPWRSLDRVADLGHFFLVIDPKKFAPGFEVRMSDMNKICRTSKPAEGETEVLVAGDPERRHMKQCDEMGGIPYHPNQIENTNKLAERLNIKPMPVTMPSNL